MANPNLKLVEDLRFDAVNRLKHELRDQNLFALARTHNVTVSRNGRLNKGWVGQTIERVGNILGGNLKRPDGADFELKSVSLLKKSDDWVPKETMAITSFNPETILRERFEESALWQKLSRMIVVGCFHESPERCWVKKGTSKGFIQLRTKGSGKSESVCPVTGRRFKTRAFYATKEFLKYVLGTM